MVKLTQVLGNFVPSALKRKQGNSTTFWPTMGERIAMLRQGQEAYVDAFFERINPIRNVSVYANGDTVLHRVVEEVADLYLKGRAGTATAEEKALYAADVDLLAKLSLGNNSSLTDTKNKRGMTPYDALHNDMRFKGDKNEPDYMKFGIIRLDIDTAAAKRSRKEKLNAGVRSELSQVSQAEGTTAELFGHAVLQKTRTGVAKKPSGR